MHPAEIRRTAVDGMADRLAIENGLIFDGSDNPAFEGTVVIEGGRLTHVGWDHKIDDAEIVDAAGLAVAPGFIDMHTHSDVSVLSDPDCVSAIWQGVTSQIVGHCGFSAAPTDETTRRTLKKEEPVFGFPGPDAQEVDWGWESISAYLDQLSETRPRTNVGTLVGHNTLRRLVVGSESRAPTDDELRAMAALARLSIEQGALGVSTGLSYPPGLYAETREIVALARAAARSGRRYHTHMRYGGAPVRESLEEAIETGRRAECQVNVSHLYPTADDGDNEANVLLEMIDGENERGGDVTFDLTLFTRGGGAWSQSLPGWALEGGLAALTGRVEDPAQRQRLLSEVIDLNRTRDWDDDLIVKVSGPESSSLVGRSIGDLARDSGRSPEETVIELLRNDPQFWIAPTIKRQTDLDLLLQHERCVPVTDGMAAHPRRHAHLGLMPKTFGTFPLLLGDYVRRRDVLGLAEAISRVTSLPADRLGLADRGRLTPGLRADVVVFDPASIDNAATDDNPGEPPVGVRDVMVNGVWALRDGRLTSETSGVVLT